MAIPVTLCHQGALVSAPASAPSSLLERLTTNFEATYQASRSGHPTVVNATSMAPFVIALEGIAKVRVFGLRVNSGDMTVVFSSSVGTDQQINVGGLGIFLWYSPYSGDELTAIKLLGTGDADFLIAGDL